MVDLSLNQERTVPDIVSRELKNENDFNIKEKSVGDRNAPVFNYPTLITTEILSQVWKDRRHEDRTDLVLDLPRGGKKVNQSSSPILIYHHIHFPYGISLPIDDIIVEMCI